MTCMSYHGCFSVTVQMYLFNPNFRVVYCLKLSGNVGIAVHENDESNKIMITAENAKVTHN